MMTVSREASCRSVRFNPARSWECSSPGGSMTTRVNQPLGRGLDEWLGIENAYREADRLNGEARGGLGM